jgi:GAF domain-containing protein
MYPIVCEHMLSAFNAEYAAINLLDSTRGVMTRVHAAGSSAESPGQEFPITGRRSERVLKTGTTMLGVDFWEGRLSPWAPPDSDRFGPYAIVPLRSGEEIIGTFFLARRRMPEGRPFTQEEVNLLESLAEIGGAAIRRARLAQDLQRQVDRLQSLYEFSHRLRAAPTLEGVNAILVEQGMAAITDAAYGSVALFDRERGTLTRMLTRGLSTAQPQATFPISTGWSKHLLETGTPYVSPDAFQGPCPPWWTPEAYGHLGPIAIVPLRSEDEIIGTLLMARRRPPEGHPFTDEEVDLLKGLAEIGGTAIRRAQLYQDLQAQVDRLQCLYNLSRRLRAGQTLDEMYQMIGNEAMATFGAHQCSLALLDAAGTTLTRVFSAGASAMPRGSTYPLEGTRTAEVIRTGKPYVTDDIMKEPLVPWADAERVAEQGPRVFVPVRSEAGIVGVLSLSRLRKGRPFTEEEVLLLEAIAEIGGTAIRRVQLYEHLRSQIDTLRSLYNASKQFAESLDLQQLARDAVRVCVESFGVEAAWLGRMESDGTVRPMASHPQEMEFARQIVQHGADSDQVVWATGRALKSGVPEVTQDITAVSRRPPWQAGVLAAGLRSVGGFPLISRTRTFGVLGLYSREPGFFTPARIEFFQSYANQLASALEKRPPVCGRQPPHGAAEGTAQHRYGDQQQPRPEAYAQDSR